MAQAISPSLEPAFTARLYPEPGFTIGEIGAIPIASGKVVSEPGFSVPLDAEIVFGSDFVRINSSQSHTRIHVRSILKNTNDTLMTYSYRGIIKVDAGFMAIMTGSPDEKTTDFGNAVSHVTFQAGPGPFRELEHSLFVGSARFIVVKRKDSP